MKEFSDFEKWIEESGASRQIGDLAGQTVSEFLRTGKGDSLSAEQQDAVFNMSIRVSSQVTAGMLQAYHEWANK